MNTRITLAIANAVNTLAALQELPEEWERMAWRLARWKRAS